MCLDLESDSTAAIDIGGGRAGLGKVRHLHVADLWVQEKRKSGEIRYRKVLGTENCAGAMTKEVLAETLQKYCKLMGARRTGTTA